MRTKNWSDISMLLKMPEEDIQEIGQREECEIPDYCKPNLEDFERLSYGSCCRDK